MKTIIARESQIYSIFGKSKFKLISKEDWTSIYEFDYNDSTHKIKIIDPGEHQVDWNVQENNLEWFEESKDNILFNPPQDSIILMDRWIFDGCFIGFYHTFGLAYVKKLEEVYKKKNVKVILANAYFEPLDYENRHYVPCSLDYDFDFTRFSDYPLFEKCKNTKVDTFYSLWNYIYDILSYEVSPNNRQEIENGKEVYYDWLDTLVNPKEDRPYVFGMLGGKPRYHRLYLINKCIESGLIDKGYLTMNKWFLHEYHQAIKENNLFTDGAASLKPQIKNFWNLDFYKPISYYKKIQDPLGLDKRFEYASENIRKEEYNQSYIEIVAETHIIWDKLYGFWSEKTYHGIFFEKLFVSVGANRFYKEFEKLGGHTFIKELGINPLFLEEDDPIKQMDYLIEALEKISLEDAKRIYIESLPKIRENKSIILDWIYKNTEFLRDYILT